MANEIMLCFLDGDSECIEIAELYWLREADGSWTYTVTQIGESLGLSQYQVSCKVPAVAVAHIVDKRCPQCGNPHLATRYCLQHFSIPKLRYLIWKVAKDTAAYAARRDVHRRQAMNSIPGSVIRVCDRALADQWEVHPYVLKWDEEEALITTMLFDRVLRTGVTGFKAMTGQSLFELVGETTPNR
jgi:hypothetical protein